MKSARIVKLCYADAKAISGGNEKELQHNIFFCVCLHRRIGKFSMNITKNI